MENKFTKISSKTLIVAEPSELHLTESEQIYISKVCSTEKGVMLILNIRELFVIR